MQTGATVKNTYFLVFLLFFLAGNAVAETRYVSDVLEITLRSGKGTSFGITRMLRSGTAVQVLEVDKKSGYTQVRTKSGKEGWVLSRFLMNGRAARERLAATEKSLAELELENRKLTTSMSTLTEEKKTLASNLGELEGESRSVSQELTEIKRTASSALAIDSENKDLKGRLVSLERQLQTVQQENQSLKDRTARDWFMVGAAVVLLGIFIGLIIPKIRFRKKSSWDTF
ncbi:MAG TPA: TIGR04211 family SH3 domain-containing protein [Gammaproteobacteria bacterium]|nr:TIGR04211 family SH3 domain-containing protein [Gammaproteobacteria bacterium]